MRTEILKIFDNEHNVVGVAPREAVHRLGYWHETFHCWFASKEDGIDYIFLQIRSAEKDYPNKLDVTVAGHLLAHETVADGVREVREELGIAVPFDALSRLGVFKDQIVGEGFIDKEFANVFLYRTAARMADFTLQRDEVAGIVKAEFKQLNALWQGTASEVEIEGFTTDRKGRHVSINKRVDKSHFVPHELAYYEGVLNRMHTILC